MTPGVLLGATRPRPAARRAEPAFVAGLAQYGDRTALVAGDDRITYRELDAAVDEVAGRLEGPRRLVAVLASRRIEDVVHYLGALRAGLPVALVPRCRPDAVLARYAPEVIVRDGRIAADTRTTLDRDLHDDLAVLLSTSGSTGSPRLVRLSHANLDSNAEAVVATLALTDTDRAVTTLEPTYSYGLSVLHSHLAAGAGVVLTDLSVTDPGFEDIVRRHGVTTMAAVPYTFELLDRLGTSMLDTPSLRQLTCAGGRLPAATARRYAELGERLGFELVVMYGATEATARMAVLPPHLAASHPGTVGHAVPGGAFRLDAVDADGVGELVYTGPNVMLGYAESSADLARGRDVDELVTGDRARFTPEGLVEIVGRRTQIAKVHGLRVDLADVDRELEEAGIDAVTVALDGALGVAAVGIPAHVASAVVVAATGLPPASVRVAVFAALPRLDNGKVDRATAAARIGDGDDSQPDPPVASAEHLRRRYQALLGVPVRADQSFADVGGDSLSYVAVSIAVEDTLGHLPRDWHSTAVADLVATATPQRPPEPLAGRRRSRQVETSVVLRALAIVLVVASHVDIIDVRGGSHLLLALVGFNFARFQLAMTDPAERLRRMMRSTAEILLPAFVIMTVLALSPAYEWYVLGATSWVIPTTEGPEWRYWFIEALLWFLPTAALAVRMPWIETWRRRAPWLIPAAATMLAWSAFSLWVPDARPAELFSPLATAWVILLGWVAAEARSIRLRIATSALVLATVVPSYDETRQWVIPIGLLALLWLPTLRLPMRVLPMVTTLAEASLYIYLTHWMVLGVLDEGWTALALSIAAGVLTFRTAGRARAALARGGADDGTTTTKRASHDLCSANSTESPVPTSGATGIEAGAGCGC